MTDRERALEEAARVADEWNWNRVACVEPLYDGRDCPKNFRSGLGDAIRALAAPYPKPELPEQYGHDPHDTTRENYLRNVQNNAPAPAPASLDDAAREVAELTRERDELAKWVNYFKGEYQDKEGMSDLILQCDVLTRERDEARELALKGICHDAVGDEWGHFPCPYRKRAEAAERERDELKRGAEAWRQMTETQDRRIAELEFERDNLLDQLALRSESAMAKDNQEIMRINNELVAERDGYLRAKDTWKGLQKGTVKALAQVERERDALRERVESAEAALKSLMDAYGNKTWGTEYAMRWSLPYARAHFAKYGA